MFLFFYWLSVFYLPSYWGRKLRYLLFIGTSPISWKWNHFYKNLPVCLKTNPVSSLSSSLLSLALLYPCLLPSFVLLLVCPLYAVCLRRPLLFRACSVMNHLDVCCAIVNHPSSFLSLPVSVCAMWACVCCDFFLIFLFKS